MGIEGGGKREKIIEDGKDKSTSKHGKIRAS